MTCQGISLGLVSIGCCFFLSVTRRGLLFVLHTECLGIIFFITNYRIIEYLSHGMSRKVTDFFVPRLVLGPTDRREVICELSNCFFTRNVAEVTDFFLSRDLSLDPLTNGGVIAEFL